VVLVGKVLENFTNFQENIYVVNKVPDQRVGQNTTRVQSRANNVQFSWPRCTQTLSLAPMLPSSFLLFILGSYFIPAGLQSTIVSQGKKLVNQ